MSLLVPFIAAIVGGLTLHWIRQAIRAGKPVTLASDSGTIRPDRWTGWIITLLGLAFALASAWATFFSDFGLIGIVGVVLGLVLAAFMSPSVTSVHAVNWDSSGIEGATTLFGGTLGFKRSMIRWEHVVRAGTTATSYWYLESKDGVRVHWSYLYPGYVRLTEAIRAHCPNLELPADMA